MPAPQPIELNRAVPGGRVEIFAVRDEECPDGWFYGSQYYHPETGELLRYDDAHDDDDLGWHHRHVRFGEDAQIGFHGLAAHVTRFLNEIATMADTENTHG